MDATLGLLPGVGCRRVGAALPVSSSLLEGGVVSVVLKHCLRQVLCLKQDAGEFGVIPGGLETRFPKNPVLVVLSPRLLACRSCPLFWSRCRSSTKLGLFASLEPALLLRVPLGPQLSSCSLCSTTGYLLSQKSSCLAHLQVVLLQAQGRRPCP